MIERVALTVKSSCSYKFPSTCTFFSEILPKILDFNTKIKIDGVNLLFVLPVSVKVAELCSYWYSKCILS